MRCRQLYNTLTCKKRKDRLAIEQKPEYDTAIGSPDWTGPKVYDLRELDAYAHCFRDVASEARRTSLSVRLMAPSVAS